MSKKTVSVAWLLEKTNHLLAYDGAANVGKEHRLGAASLLESVLHATGNYAGFGYLSPYRDAPDFDESRRVYHRSYRLDR